VPEGVGKVEKGKGVRVILLDDLGLGNAEAGFLEG